MALKRAQCYFQGLSGLPEDRFVNDIWFDSTSISLSDADADTFRDAWALFFNDVITDTLADFMSDQIDRSADACVINFYDGLTPGPPEKIRTWTLNAIGAVQSLPNEVAYCLSFAASTAGVAETAANPSPPPATIRPASRRRGRIYLGPLNVGVLGTESGDVKPHADFQARVGAGAGAFAGTLFLSSIPWVVYSKADDFFRDVSQVWTDDAFDTQRRRGMKPSAKTYVIGPN
jgi:hypothetical protein